MSNQAARELLIKLLCSIEHLHQLGFQHHNLSLSSIWRGGEEEDRLVLLDWWRWTLTGGGELAPFKSDPRYAPPEVLIRRIKGLRGSSGFDYTGDVYAIGMIIAELLLGVRPWRNVSEFDIIRVATFVVLYNTNSTS